MSGPGDGADLPTTPPAEGPEVGILLTRAQAELLVDLAGGPALLEGRDAVVAELTAAEVLVSTADGGLVLAPGMDVLADVLARPEVTLDLHLIAGTERRRSLFLATAEGSVRVVEVPDGMVVTPVRVEELLLRVALDVGLPPDPPPTSPERRGIGGEELRRLLDDGRLPVGVEEDDPVFRPFAEQGYVASATAGSAALFWVAGRDGSVSVVRPDTELGGGSGWDRDVDAPSVAEQSSGFGVLLALGSMLAPALAGVEFLLPPLRD